jgi:hypothetical protein
VTEFDPSKLQALLATANARVGYERWLEQFLIPLLKKVGFTVSVKRNMKSWTFTVKFPNAQQAR